MDPQRHTVAARRHRGPAPLLILLALMLISDLASPAAAGVHPGTIGLDYRNRPDVAALTGYEYVVLSPRAAGEANELFSRGSKILYWIQPVVCSWQGQPPSADDFQGAAYRLAERHGAILRDSTGAEAEIRGSDISACYVLDFRNRKFAEELADLVTTRFQGISGLLFDYGCPDLSWELSLGAVPDSVWSEWARGYRLYRTRIGERNPGWNLYCQCDRWTSWLSEVCTGLVLEKVGWSLIPYRAAWERMTRHPAQNVLLIERAGTHPGPSRRRLTAALCYLTDGLFAYRDAASRGRPPIRDPEHFELHLGEFDEPFHEVAPGIYERLSSHGRVVANLSEKAYPYEGFTIPPGDALIAQTHDEQTGEPIEWLTTLDR